MIIESSQVVQAEIQTLYSLHRTKRNAQQAEKFLATGFEELIIDQTLLRLEVPTVEPGFRDNRNCLVFWARPPDHIIRLASKVNELLKKAAPGKINTSDYIEQMLTFKKVSGLCLRIECI